MSDNPSNNEPTPIADPVPGADRRAFLRTAAWGGGLLGLGGLAGYAVKRFPGKPQGTATPPLGDEFTYDVARYQKSDPALIRYEEVMRFPCGLERARNLTAGPDGSIWVAGTGGIRRFSNMGAPLLTIEMDQPVHSIALGKTGEILAGMAGKISVLDDSGTETAIWSDYPENFLPTSIALVGDRIFVADAGNRVVLKLDSAGNKTGVIGEKDPARNIAGFRVPSPYFCVRMAPDGLLRVTNPGEHRIEAYTFEGDLEGGWGKSSFAVEGFCGCCNPVSFDIFPDGAFVTCEKGLPRVKLYDPDGNFTGLVAGPEAFPEYLNAANAGTPNSLGSGIYTAIDPQGRVLVLDGVGGTVRIMKTKN